MTALMVTIRDRETGRQRSFTVSDPDPAFVVRRISEWVPDVCAWLATGDTPTVLPVEEVPIELWEELTDGAA